MKISRSIHNMIFLLAVILSSDLWAQEDQLDLKVEEERDYYQYDSDYLPPAFHAAMRDSLRALLPDSTAAVFVTAPERKRANDVYYEYHQDPNFYYLSGYREPNGLLVVYKEEQELSGGSTNEILFLQDRDPQSEVWNGRRLGDEGAEEKLMLKDVRVNKELKGLEGVFEDLKGVYFISPEALEGLDTNESKSLDGLIHHFQKKMTDDQRQSEKALMKMMAEMRQQKHAEEMKLLRKAINITCKAQNQLMLEIEPDMTEYQTEAVIEYIFKKEGAEYTGFPSIQGSGENSCILHYTSNRRPLNNGGLLLSDVGAEYHGYTADVTRTIPPSGKFSEEEKIIYDLVYAAQSAGIDSCKVGNSFWAPHLAASKVLVKGLMELGIIEKPSELRQYFMHGTSHYLGLDVHDAGLYMPLAAGQVITVEPGIYIAEGSDCDPKWWNIGVRIEDDILITEEGPENLSDCSPRASEAIEALMQQNQ